MYCFTYKIIEIKASQLWNATDKLYEKEAKSLTCCQVGWLIHITNTFEVWNKWYGCCCCKINAFNTLDFCVQFWGVITWPHRIYKQEHTQVTNERKRRRQKDKTSRTSLECWPCSFYNNNWTCIKSCLFVVFLHLYVLGMLLFHMIIALRSIISQESNSSILIITYTSSWQNSIQNYSRCNKATSTVTDTQSQHIWHCQSGVCLASIISQYNAKARIVWLKHQPFTSPSLCVWSLPSPFPTVKLEIPCRQAIGHGDCAFYIYSHSTVGERWCEYNSWTWCKSVCMLS